MRDILRQRRPRLSLFDVLVEFRTFHIRRLQRCQIQARNILDPFGRADIEILDLLVGIKIHLQGSGRHHLRIIVENVSKGTALEEDGVTLHRQRSFDSTLGLHSHRPDATGEMRMIIICQGWVGDPEPLVATIQHIHKLML